VPPPAFVLVIWSRSAACVSGERLDDLRFVVEGPHKGFIFIAAQHAKQKIIEASCSNLMRSRMLLEVSSSMPMRSGRSVWLAEVTDSCGALSSQILKSALSRLGNKLVGGG